MNLNTYYVNPGLFIRIWPKNTKYSKFIKSSLCCYACANSDNRFGSNADRIILALSADIMYSKARTMWILCLTLIL